MNETQNGKIVRFHGQIFRLITCRLGGRLLADAECIFGPDKGKVVNLMASRSPLANGIRSAAKMGLVS
jgi:hypothetical protein